jgi:hypothetical protein
MATYELLRAIGSPFGPLVEPVGARNDDGYAEPLTVDPNNALYVTSHITSNFRVSEQTLLAGDVFEGVVLDSDEWLSAVVNLGTVIVNNGQAEIRTNTTANGGAKIYSSRLGRFLVNNTNVFKGIVRLNELNIANNKKHWGVLDVGSGNGLLFENDGTNINLIVRNNNTDTVIPSSSFNGSGNFVYDTNFHSYEIYYIHDGILFYQDGMPIHKLFNPSGPFLAEYDLPVFFDNNNYNSSTIQTSMFITAGSISRLGDASNKPVFQYIDTPSTAMLLKGDAGTLTKVVVTNGGATGATLTLFDGLNNSGRIITKINTSAIIGELVYEVDFNIGLYVTTDLKQVGSVTIIYS